MDTEGLCVLSKKDTFLKRQKVSVSTLQENSLFCCRRCLALSPQRRCLALRPQRLWCVRSGAVRFVCKPPDCSCANCVTRVMRHEEQIGRFYSRMPCLGVDCLGLTKGIIRSNWVVYIHKWHPILARHCPLKCYQTFWAACTWNMCIMKTSRQHRRSIVQIFVETCTKEGEQFVTPIRSFVE